MQMYTDEQQQLIDSYAERRYKRWVRQKIRLLVSFILIVLLLLINIVLIFILIFSRPDCDCPEPTDCLIVEDAGYAGYAEEDEEVDIFIHPNAIPGRYAFLTFDDGPSPYTERLLAILNERRAPAIFFVLGESINRRTDSQSLLNQILEEGHYIGLHSMSHDFATLYAGEGAPGRFVDEMFQVNQLISEMTGGFSTNLCRAPFGMAGTFTPEHHFAVDAAGLYCIDWNIDSHDWSQRNAYMVHYNVTSQIEQLDFPDELVILFHEFSWTAEALPGIIDYLRYHGYTIIAYNPGDLLTYYRSRY